MKDSAHSVIEFTPDQRLQMVNYVNTNKVGGIIGEYIIDNLAHSLIAPDDCVVDGGANTGSHTAKFMENIGDNGVVYAIEAIPALHDRIKQKYANRPGCRPINAILFHSDNIPIKFNYIKNQTAYSGIHHHCPDSLKPDIESLELPSITLDTLLKDEKRNISFIKLDLEGAERDALMGAEQILKEKRPVVIFEDGRKVSAEQYGYNFEDFYNFITGSDYAIFGIFGERYKNIDDYAHPALWNTILVPEEKVADVYPAIAKAAAEELYKFMCNRTVISDKKNPVPPTSQNTGTTEMQSLSKKYEKEIAELTSNKNDLLEKNRLMAEELAGVYQSKSWRITSPLRLGAKLLRHKK